MPTHRRRRLPNDPPATYSQRRYNKMPEQACHGCPYDPLGQSDSRRCWLCPGPDENYLTPGAD